MLRGLALLSGLALGACAGRDRGQPSRIISLNPCTDVLLVELADRDQIGALSSYSRDPLQSSMDVAAAARYPSTRGALEEVVAARPSMIVSGNFTPPATRAAYARMGLRLEEFSMAANVEDSEAQIRRMAALLGHPERGGHDRADRAIFARCLGPRWFQAFARADLAWRGLVVGRETLVSDLLRRTGFTPLPRYGAWANRNICLWSKWWRTRRACF
jgi:iron complex transport system substrate-binding protein